jgi:hypothetical protein
MLKYRRMPIEIESPEQDRVFLAPPPCLSPAKRYSGMTGGQGGDQNVKTLNLTGEGLIADKPLHFRLPLTVCH